jgi:uncharacterized membrane protein YdjX (TVP38/TMEM64 family)
MSIWGIVIGAIVALIVYAVGVAITPADIDNEGLIWFLIALVVWAVIAFRGDEIHSRFRR